MKTWLNSAVKTKQVAWINVSKSILSKIITPTTVTIVVCLVYVLGVLLQNSGDPLTFAQLGTRFTQGDPQGTEGYDGQFAYQIAINPAGAAPYIDVPAYRYQRIIYPITARLLAFGQPALVPWTLILVNIVAIGLGTWATERLLKDFRVSRWYALAYGLYGGQMMALRTDLNEPLAQMFIQLGILTWERQHRWFTVIFFALAALTKETTLVFLAAYIVYLLQQQDWRWVLKLALAIIPFAAFQIFLWQWLGSFGLGSGGAGATSFSFIPLAGWLSMARISVPGFLLVSLIVVPLSILPAIAGIILAIRSLRRGESHPIIFCLLLNAVVLLLLPMSTFREPVAMLRLTQGLAVSMLLYGALKRSWRILNYCCLWIFANVLLVKGTAS